MKVAIIHYAEPVSRDDGFVITRYASVAKCLLENNFKVTRYFPSFDHRSRKFRKFGNYNDKQFGNHIKITTPSYLHSRSIKRLLFLKDFKKNLMIELSKSKYDLYLVGCPMPGIASAIRKKFSNAKILIDLRDFWPDIQISSAAGIKKKIFKLLGYFFRKSTLNYLKSSDHIVTLSESYAKKIKRLCSLTYLPTIIPIGSVVDHKDNQHLSIDNLKKRKGVIFVGSLSDLFDFKKLMQIWKIFENKYPSLAKNNRLTIVGHGIKINWLLAKAKEFKFLNITGFISQKEVYRAISRSKVAIIIYKKMSFHTLPNKLFEFAKSGLPIISNWSGDVINKTKDYRFTFNCDNTSNKKIISNLVSLLTDERKVKLANKGALKFSKDYSMTNSSIKFNKIIRSLVSKNTN